MTMVFIAVIGLSLVLALLSKRGHLHQSAEDFFVASRQFRTVLFFFLAVGETYSITTILGYPGGIYAKGIGSAIWFLGYILLAFVVGYFLNPLIWRAGRLYQAVTLPDVFRRHYDSRALEVVVTLTSLVFLVPLGMSQFLGLETVLKQLNWGVPPLMLAALAGLLAFSYIAISGIRASAYVAVLKDLLLVFSILLVGVSAFTHWGDAKATMPAAKHLFAPTAQDDVFAITTILLQSVGFCIVPQTCAYIFTARSANTVRRAQITMPLYMVMFPFLTLVAFFALGHDVPVGTPNEVFLAVTRQLLPQPVVGLVMAGAVLSALVILTGICLAIGPLVSRNLLPGLDDAGQRRWSQIVIALYLLLSIAAAATSSQLLITINNFFYFGIVQALPGMLGILFVRRLRPLAIIAGLLVGDMISILIFELKLPVGGVNAGFIGLVANLAIVFGILFLLPGPERTPVCLIGQRKAH